MNPQQENWQALQKSNTLKLAASTSLWLLSFAFLSFIDWSNSPGIKLIALSLNIAAGVYMIMRNRAHLLGLDELQQRIQLNAMGTTLGIGLISFPILITLNQAGILSEESDVTVLLVVMSLCYLGAVVVGQLRYK